MIKGGATIVYVTDMDRAVDFYSNALGLKVTYRAGNDYCALDAGDGMSVGLHPSGPHSPKPGTNGSTSLGFGVTAPMEEVVAALSARGVTFKGGITEDADGGIRLAYLLDPDGNELYLCESRH